MPQLGPPRSGLAAFPGFTYTTEGDRIFIGVRNEATAQESVVMHPELDSKVP